jgi:tripartite-type tricarboxylate transporter receptor subunit TctC
MRLTSRRGLMGVAAVLAAPKRLAAQSAWPDRTVRIITPSPPGSSVDATARLLVEGLGRRYGGTWYVENRPGADGVVAAQAFVLSPPGSALLFSASGIYTAVPLMFSPLPYDTKAELVPIGTPVTDFIGFFVPQDGPAATLSGFLDLARERPRRLTWAAAGAWLVINAYLRANGIELTYVSYAALTGMLADVAGRRLDLAYLPLAPSLPLVRSGRLRLLAVSSAGRAPAAPDVPTVRELGLPELEFESFPGLFGWRGMPGALREELASHMRDIVADAAVAERLAGIGLTPRLSTPASFEADLRDVEGRYAEAARRYGVRPPD